MRIVKLPHGYIAKWLHGYINHSAIRPFNHSKARKGFTLIELLIVIAVVGVLAVGVLTAINVTSQIGKANLSKAKTFSASVENSLAINQVGKWSFEEAMPQEVTMS